MIIRRNLAGFVVFSGDSVVDALKKITANKSRIVFAVSENGILEGVLTDGDFRRWLSSQRDIDLDQPLSVAVNREFLVGSVDESTAITEGRFREGVDHIPLVDASQRIVAIAARTESGILIEGRAIDRDAPVFLIAEIGNNHNGSLDLARRLIDQAVEAGADCAKFQMRSMQALYGSGGHAADGSDDLGAQYTLDLLSRFQSKTVNCSRRSTTAASGASCRCARRGTSKVLPNSSATAWLPTKSRRPTSPTTRFSRRWRPRASR